MTSLPTPIQSILEIFKGALSNVRFADIDASGLATLAAEVETAAAEVQHHEAKLAELRQDLVQRQEALLVLAHQALAYARVYAENDEALLEELNRISLPRAAKARKPTAKTIAARDADRPAPPADTPPSLEAEAAAGSAEAPAADTGEMPSVDIVEAVPLRNGRKARGRMAQPPAG
jgi:hypothetical protein